MRLRLGNYKLVPFAYASYRLREKLELPTEGGTAKLPAPTPLSLRFTYCSRWRETWVEEKEEDRLHQVGKRGFLKPRC